MQKTLSLLGYSWISGIPIENIEVAASGNNEFSEKLSETGEVRKDFLDKYFEVTSRPFAKDVKVPVRKDLEEWIENRKKHKGATNNEKSYEQCSA